MPIYVAHAGKQGGVRLENKEAAQDQRRVRHLINHAVGQRTMRLFVLDDTRRDYALPAEAPFPEAFFQPYRVQPSDIGELLLPERARVVIPWQSPMNPDPQNSQEVCVSPLDEDGVRIVPIVSWGRGQGHEQVWPVSPRDPWQLPFPSGGLVLRGAIFHDQELYEKIDPLQRI